MNGTDKEPIGSVLPRGHACEGESSIMDQSAEEADLQDALEYAMEIYRMSFNPPLAGMRESHDNALAYIYNKSARFLTKTQILVQEFRVKLQADYEEIMEEAYKEAATKALEAFRYTTKGIVGPAKVEYEKHLDDSMRKKFEGFDELQNKRALEHAVDVLNSCLNPPSHMMSGTLKEPIGPDSVHDLTRKGKFQNVEETDCQKALDHAKDVYMSFFKPPIALVIEAQKKAQAAFNDVAVGAGPTGSIREKYQLMLLDIMDKAYKDVIKKTHDVAASKALAAFESRVGCLEQKYKRDLEDFMKNEYEGFEEAENRRTRAQVMEMFKSLRKRPAVV